MSGAGRADDAVLATVEHAAVAMTRDAGALALTHFSGSGHVGDRVRLEFKGKKADDPVTVADQQIEAFLRQAIRARFPDHGLLGEEQADDIAPGSEWVWVMDPLDGTANFAAGLPLWGVSVGVLQHGVPVVGCIWVPVGPSLGSGVYHARRGGGAWFDDRPLRVAESADTRGRVLALPGRYWRSFGFRRPPAGTPRAQRRGADNRALGSITLEMVLVASGSLLLAVFVQPKIWDVAAGVVIVDEAGGRSITWADRQWTDVRRFDPEAPDPPRRRSRTTGTAGTAAPDEPTLRAWSRPVVVGDPATVATVAERLVWNPRLPGPLRRRLGLAP